MDQKLFPGGLVFQFLFEVYDGIQTLETFWIVYHKSNRVLKHRKFNHRQNTTKDALVSTT
jgi:hypothetical protein